MMKPCSNCGTPIETNDEEDKRAFEEAIKQWGRDPSKDRGMVIICEECYRKMMRWLNDLPIQWSSPS